MMRKSGADGNSGAMGDEVTASLFVLQELGFQFVKGTELDFFAKMVEEVDLEGLTIKVAFEIEEVDFDAALLAVVKGGTSANIEHTEAEGRLRSGFFRQGVSKAGSDEIGSILRNEFQRVDLQVGSRETEFPAILETLHNGALQGIGMTEQSVGCGDVAFEDGLSDGCG